VTVKGNRRPERNGRRFPLTTNALLLIMLAFAALAAGVLGACGKGSGASIVPGKASPATAPAEAQTRASSQQAMLNAGGMLKLGEYAASAAAYNAVADVSTDPETKAEASLGAGIATYADGDTSGAIVLLQRAVASAPPGGSTVRQAAYLLGVRLDQAGRAEDAIKVLAPLAAAPLNDALTPYVMNEYATALEASGEAEWA